MTDAVLRRPNLIAVIAGGLSATGFAPLELWPVLIIAFAVLAWLTTRATTRGQALARGWAFGVGHFTIGLNWIAGAFQHQDAMPHWLGWIAVVLLSLYLALYPAVASGLAWRWSRGASGTVFALLFGAGWIVTEWLRATLFTGFAWNPVSVAAIDTPLAPLTTMIGTYGLSGLIVTLTALIATQAWRALAGGVLTLLIAGFQLGQHRPLAVRDAMLVRVVQPNISLNDGRDPAIARAGLDKLAALSGVPGKQPRIIFWPEAALNDTYEIAYDAGLRRALADLLGPNDVLVTGGTRIEYRQRVVGPYTEDIAVGATNSVFALDARGFIRARYDKAHLVPYGEYLPARPLLSAIGLARLVPGDLDFWPGPGPSSVDLPGFGKVGIQVCYEMIFSGHVVDRSNRPAFLFNPSIDAWFGAWGPPQHLAQARLRAVEEAMPVIRSTTTGISAIVDAQGRIVASVPLNKAGFLQTRLPPAGDPTVFARLGNVLPLFLALFLAGIAVALKRRRR